MVAHRQLQNPLAPQPETQAGTPHTARLGPKPYGLVDGSTVNTIRHRRVNSPRSISRVLDLSTDMKKPTQQTRVVRPWRSLLITACIATLSASSAAERSPRYSVIPLGTPINDFAESANFMQPWRINNKGDIVGLSTHGPFLYRRGAVHYLGSAGEGFEARSLLAINDRGVIIGVAQDLSLEYPDNVTSFILRDSGRDRDLNLALASLLPFPAFIAWDINDRGTIVGELGNFPNRAAAIYQHGQLRQLPGLVPGGDNVAVGINKRGQIVGSAAVQAGSWHNRPIIWSEGRMENLGILPGFFNADGTAINDLGHVVGFCNNDDTWAGFIYRDGVMSQLPQPTGARLFLPTHINNLGDVLIWFFSGQAGVYDSYWLYSNGAVHDLSPIVAEASGWPIYNLSMRDMNDRGEIVGTAQYDDGHGGQLSQGILLVPR